MKSNIILFWIVSWQHSIYLQITKFTLQMEECISVFDMLKIGVGPSSSHTLGPWRAAERFLGELRKGKLLPAVSRIKIDLYGSLSLTGKGHATDLAVMLGLSGQDPEYIPVENIDVIIKSIESKNEINLGNEKTIPFYFLQDIVFNKNFLPFHANGMTFTAYMADDSQYVSTFYSIGGGFVVKEERSNAKKNGTENKRLGKNRSVVGSQIISSIGFISVFKYNFI